MRFQSNVLTISLPLHGCLASSYQGLWETIPGYEELTSVLGNGASFTEKPFPLFSRDDVP